MANKDFKVKNGLDVSTPIPVAMGGTGQTSTANALNSLLPSQSGNSNKVLSTDGTNTTWAAQAVAYQRGGTASRPASPTAGDLYYNTDYNYFESYTANGWFPIAAAPGIPTGVTATNQGTGRAFNNGQMSVAFTPATTGGAPTSFILTPNPATSPTTFTGSTSPIVVTGLSSSTQYTHTVVSTSPYGTSSASSASSAVTATTVPQAPSLVATGLSETTASIAITAGSTGGSAITGYSIISNPATTTQTTSNTTYTFTGLTTGTAYTFTAYASNALGNSTTSSASNSITPAVTGAWESIQTITSSSNFNNASFTNIPQTYKHLQIRAMYGESRSGADIDYLLYTVNGRSSDYWTLRYGQLNNTAQSSNYTGNNGGLSGLSNYSAGVPYTYGVAILNFFDYTNANKKPSAIGYSGAVPNTFGYWSSMHLGMTSNTANEAITSIDVRPNSGLIFKPYSHIALYGIRG